MRALRLAVVGLLVAAGGIVTFGAATDGPSMQLVEGHTSFVTFANFTDIEGNISTAAAVAVLVQEIESRPSRFPGVLWFNDQYLVDPSSGHPERIRYPCTGVVLATESGNGDPRDAFRAGQATYIESYYITDPNDRSWYVDKWEVDDTETAPYLVWVAPILNNQASSTVEDDSSSCSPITDRGCPTPANSCARPPGSVEACLPDECGTIRYNAVLFMETEDLKGSGAPKNHSVGSDDRANDLSGCHDTEKGTYDCPDGNDHREGNSHPYLPGGIVEEPDGATADCTGDGRVDLGCHRTIDVDIYYGTAPMPMVRKYALYDVSGSGEALGCTFEVRGLCGGPI